MSTKSNANKKRKSRDDDDDDLPNNTSSKQVKKQLKSNSIDKSNVIDDKSKRPANHIVVKSSTKMKSVIAYILRLFNVTFIKIFTIIIQFKIYSHL
jgi:hypothetical protein